MPTVTGHNGEVVAGSLWRAEDVASYLQASRSWVYQKAEAGILPCLRIGGLLRFEPAAVYAFARGESVCADNASLASV